MAMNEAASELSSGELAARTGVSVDTLRHYEIKGVLAAPPRQGTYRRYPAEAVARVRIIRRALSIGFTLDELARVFAQRASGRPPCRSVLQMAESKRGELERRIAALLAMRDDLDAVLAEWRTRLELTPVDRPARLIDSLEETHR